MKHGDIFCVTLRKIIAVIKDGGSNQSSALRRSFYCMEVAQTAVLLRHSAVAVGTTKIRTPWALPIDHSNGRSAGLPIAKALSFPRDRQGLSLSCWDLGSIGREALKEKYQIMFRIPSRFADEFIFSLSFNSVCFLSLWNLSTFYNGR